MKQAIRDRQSQQSSRTGRVVYGEQHCQSRQKDQLKGINKMVNKTADSSHPSKYPNNGKLKIELIKQEQNSLQDK